MGGRALITVTDPSGSLLWRGSLSSGASARFPAAGGYWLLSLDAVVADGDAAQPAEQETRRAVEQLVDALLRDGVDALKQMRDAIEDPLAFARATARHGQLLEIVGRLNRLLAETRTARG
jgi:hypothetical protein